MDRSKEWLVPLTGVAFVLVGIVGFLIGGEPKSRGRAGERGRRLLSRQQGLRPARRRSSGLPQALLLIFFGAYLRKVLHAAGGEGEMLSLVSFIGLVLVGLGFAIDGTISFALAEAADDIDPIAVQALQALWDNDFLPIMLGVLAFLWATGISVVRSGALPKWMGWLMIVLGIAAVTPIGFVSLPWRGDPGAGHQHPVVAAGPLGADQHVTALSQPGDYDRGLTTTGVPRRGEKVMLRRAMPSGRRRAPRSSQRRSVSRRTTRISNSANAAPRQRRTPPPNGIQA